MIITLFQERLTSTDLHYMLNFFNLSNDGCIQHVHLSTLLNLESCKLYQFLLNQYTDQ